MGLTKCKKWRATLHSASTSTHSASLDAAATFAAAALPVGMRLSAAARVLGQTLTCQQHAYHPNSCPVHTHCQTADDCKRGAVQLCPQYTHMLRHASCVGGTPRSGAFEAPLTALP